MKSRDIFGLAAFALLVVTGRHAPAQGFGPNFEPGTVIVTTIDESRVSGKIRNSEFVMRTETLGDLKIPAERIEMVRLSDDGDTLQTRGNSMVRGKFDLDVLELDSEFGPLRIPRAKIIGFASANSGMWMMGGGMGGMGIGGMGGFGGGAATAPPAQEEPAKADEADPAK